MKHIYFVRHGETDWNKEGRGQGWRGNHPLNNTGKIQAKKTGIYLHEYQQNNTKFDHIIASPLSRAKETAHIIAKEIGFNPENIEYDDNLKERNNGKFYGTTKAEREESRDFDSFNNMMQNILKTKDPIERMQLLRSKERLNEDIKLEVEPLDEFEKRCNKAIQNIIKNEYKKILVVAHGGSIEKCIKLMFNLGEHYPIGKFYNDVKNCHTTYITYTQKKGFYLVSPANTEHLEFIKLSTKGGFYKKYHKYKSKYMALKKIIL